MEPDLGLIGIWSLGFGIWQRPEHNCRVLRRLMLAALIGLAVWTVAESIAVCPSAVRVAADPAPCVLSAADAPEAPASRWNAAHRQHASLTESLWRSPLHHAELAGALNFGGLHPTAPPRLSQRPAARDLRQQYSTPLLI